MPAPGRRDSVATPPCVLRPALPVPQSIPSPPAPRWHPSLRDGHRPSRAKAQVAPGGRTPTAPPAVPDVHGSGRGSDEGPPRGPPAGTTQRRRPCTGLFTFKECLLSADRVQTPSRTQPGAHAAVTRGTRSRSGPGFPGASVYSREQPDWKVRARTCVPEKPAPGSTWLPRSACAKAAGLWGALAPESERALCQ